MGKPKILIVDDNELVLTMARDALEEAGYEVSTAVDGLQANNYIFAKNKPDLMIFDIMLPMLNGDRKVQMLRQKELGRQTPILLLSGKSEAELRDLTAQAGADGYIHKPFTAGEIVEAVRKALALKPAAAAS